ncbi:MAG: hypothetical protein D6B27_08345 [Gammaproteobacteria bacterium]|nr:MAG: hypothetical protein D6B27_08345 [Gammaproteobacteria bacterium]
MLRFVPQHNLCAKYFRCKFLVIFIWSLFFLAITTDANSNDIDKKGGNINTLALNMYIKINEFFPGESIPVMISIINKGNAAVEIDYSQMESPFLYQLKKLNEPTAEFTISQKTSAEKFLKQFIAKEKLVLAPQEKVERREDLTEYLAFNLLPGTYQLQAFFENKEAKIYSEVFQFNVVNFDSQWIKNTYCPVTELWNGILINKPPSGEPVVFVRPSRKQSPLSASLYRLESGTHFNPPITTPTASIQANIAGNEGCWHAWLEGSVFSGIRVWGGPGGFKSKAIDTGFTDAFVLSPGYQQQDQSALFIVAGYKSSQTYLAAYITKKDDSRKVFEIPFQQKQLPSKFWTYYDFEKGMLNCIWISNERGENKVLSQSIQLNNPDDSKVEVKYTTKENILALAIEPVNTNNPVSIHLLTNSNKENKLEYHLLPLFSGNPTFKYIPKFNSPVTTWLISANEREQPVIIKSEDCWYWYHEKSSNQWNLLEPLQKISSFVSLSDLGNGEFWLEWADKEEGVQHRLLPFSKPQVLKKE